MSGKKTQRQSTAIAGGVFVCLLPVGCQAATKGSDRQSVHQIVWPTQNSPVSMICVRNRTKCKRKQKTSKETCIGGVIYCSALLPPPRVLRSSCVHTVSLAVGGSLLPARSFCVCGCWSGQVTSYSKAHSLTCQALIYLFFYQCRRGEKHNDKYL